MKVFFIFLFSLTSVAQTTDQLRDMLNGGGFEQYEKIFQDMIEDIEALDKSQFEQYDKFFNQSILKQLQLFGGNRRTYKWVETEEERVLVFDGRLDESANPELEIKDNFFSLKATFIKETEVNGLKSTSKSIQSLKISLPGDIDITKVRYENLDNSFKVIFPKNTSAIKKQVAPTKKLRSPLKGSDSDITI